MNHPRKKAAVKKHFSEPYETQEELRAGLKADEAGYKDEEIEEIMEAIKEQAKAPAQPSETVQGPTAEELAEFKAWKENQKSLQAGSPTELAAAVIKAVPPPTKYKDYDEFRGTVVKTSVPNPANPERPHVIILHIDLGKVVRMARMEPALAHEFNEFAIGHDAGFNHGQGSTALFYFPKGEKQNGDQVSYTEFAAFQRKDIRYKPAYNPRINISLIIAAETAASDY